MTKKVRRALCVLLAGFGTLTLAVQAVAQDQAARTFEAELAARWDALSVPGLGFAVVTDGSVTEAGGFGVADAGTGELVTANTPFRVASLTKPISAALYLNAVEAGRGNLDMPLREASSRFAKACRPMKAYFVLNKLPYLQGIPCDDDTIMVRHVLSHTAPHGEAFAYNGFLFGLLSDEIGDVTVGGGDDNFVRAVRQEIIEPLALGDAAAGIGDAEGQAVVSRLAAPHRRDDGRWVTVPALTDELNAGAGFVASAADMAVIDAAYRDDLLAPGVWTRMTTPPVLANGKSSPYGMGWFVQVIGGREVHWHYGHQPGAYSGLWVKDTDNARTLIALANGDGLAAGLSLHEGDLTTSDLAVAFLDWSAKQPRPVTQPAP